MDVISEFIFNHNASSMKLSRNKKLIFATSTKNDGNMSLFKGNVKNVVQNREKFLNRFGLNTQKIITLKLVHKDDIHIAARKDLGKGATIMASAISKDALITSGKGIYPFVLTADCLPIAVYDSKNHAIGLIHASSLNIGTIIEKTLNKMVITFKTKPKDLIIEIGPSIGPCHYNKDLWEQTQKTLENFGVRNKNIVNDKICTYSENYYSHREFVEKNLHDDNRIATVFGIKA